MTTQITLRELLKDPNYRAWFTKIPKLRVVHHTPPWRLYAQREEGGKWARKDYRTYPEAYNAVRSRLQEFHDLIIHCKPQAFPPPIIEFQGRKFYLPPPPGHLWCVYCRRPTVFGFFSKHHAMPGRPIPDYDLRCGGCGARHAGMKPYKSKLDWETYSGRELL